MDRSKAGLFFGFRIGVDGPAMGSTVGFLTMILPLAGLDALIIDMCDVRKIWLCNENKSQIEVYFEKRHRIRVGGDR